MTIKPIMLDKDGNIVVTSGHFKRWPSGNVDFIPDIIPDENGDCSRHLQQLLNQLGESAQ